MENRPDKGWITLNLKNITTHRIEGGVVYRHIDKVVMHGGSLRSVGGGVSIFDLSEMVEMLIDATRHEQGERGMIESGVNVPDETQE